MIKMPGAIVELQIEQLPGLESLLQQNQLPFEDCEQHIDNIIGIFEGGDLIAAGGIEVLGSQGLLRSVAVHKDFRGQGLATAIVDYLQQRACSCGLQALYLLTETAGSYFARRDYRFIARDQLPPEVQSTQQFQSLCPASAQAMVIYLRMGES
ncbi:MAG: GNAT family N-acetyltransferase [Gammaproteobacteria bacterium]|nr:GNAT family N-acetyltransferase [Gammaproteobacteria bacterium]